MKSCDDELHVPQLSVNEVESGFRRKASLGLV